MRSAGNKKKKSCTEGVDLEILCVLTPFAVLFICEICGKLLLHLLVIVKVIILAVVVPVLRPVVIIAVSPESSS